MINIEDFKKLDIVIAEIKEVEDHPNADKLYVIRLSVASEEKQVVAGIKGSYTKDELKGKKVVLINNLEPAVIRGQESRGMILAAKDIESQKISLLTVDKEVNTSSKVS